MITKQIIENFFNNLKGDNDFNANDYLVWGFFFIGADKNMLKALGKHLENEGYLFVDIFEADKEEANDKTEYYLHLEKFDKHDINSLMCLNEILQMQAIKFNSRYDGFDVGG